MKKIHLTAIICLLCFAFLVAGCAPNIDPTEDATTEPTVLDDFTNPTTEPTQALTETLSGVELEKQKFEDSMRMIQRMSVGLDGGYTGDPDKASWYVYDGGELEVQLSMHAVGARDIGLGVYLFLDGKPQPYRTENGEFQYMHIFYPKDGRRVTENVYLYPVTGQEGDTLEIVAVCVGWPKYFLDVAPKALQHTSCITGHGMEVRFEADAPEQAAQSNSVDVITWSMKQEDLAGKEIDGWSAENLQNNIESHLYVNEVRDSGNIWSYSGADPLTLRYEVWGGTLGQYGLVFFVDNEPVFMNDEPWIPIQLENGEKTVVEVELDMSEYDGSSVVYALLVGRNYFADGIGNGAFSTFKESGTFYICSAASHDQLMGWDE